jgi:hypothetical protein
MKANSNSSHSKPDNAFQMSVSLVVAVVTVLGTIAALNGGTTLTASAWDSMVTYLQNMLSSTWVLVLAFVALLITVWQLMHGGGYRTAGVILAILAFALIGPGVVKALATATGEPGSITTPPAAIHWHK